MLIFRSILYIILIFYFFTYLFPEIILSFFSLFSFVPQKSVVLPTIFMSGLRRKSHGHLLGPEHLLNTKITPFVR